MMKRVLVIGASSTDVIMLVMSDRGAEKLLASKTRYSAKEHTH